MTESIVIIGVVEAVFMTIVLLIILEAINMMTDYLRIIAGFLLSLLVTLLAQVAVSLKWVALKLRKRQDELLNLSEQPEPPPHESEEGTSDC